MTTQSHLGSDPRVQLSVGIGMEKNGEAPCGWGHVRCARYF